MKLGLLIDIFGNFIELLRVMNLKMPRFSNKQQQFSIEDVTKTRLVIKFSIFDT